MGNLYLSVADPPKVTAQILDEEGWTEVVIEGRGGAFVLNLRSPEHADRVAIAIADAITVARADYRDAEMDAQQFSDAFDSDAQEVSF